MRRLSIAIFYLLTMAAAAAWRGSFDDAYFAVPPASGEWTPKSVSGLVLWLDADQITGLNDWDKVLVWPDASGYHNDATNVYEAWEWGSEIYYNASSQGGKPSVYFGKYGYFLIEDSASLTFSGEFTVFLVIMRITDEGWHNTVPITKGAGDPNRGFCIYGPLTLDWGYTNANVYFWPQPAPHLWMTNWTYDTWYYVTTHFSTTADSARLNGVLEQSVDHRPMTNAPAPVCIGSLYPWDPDNSWHQMYGYISEILVYNNAVSTSSRERIETYLKNKYGL